VKDLARSATTEMVLRALNRIPADLRQILRGLTALRIKSTLPRKLSLHSVREFCRCRPRPG
jgi:hypothetical protein